MLQTRVIPCLLYHDKGLYKTQMFKNPKYVGDPVNTMRIFNDKEVDEIIILDIDASKENRGPDFEFIEDIVSEAFMPLAYGGGVATEEHIKNLFRVGVEKFCINTGLQDKEDLIKWAVSTYGGQSIQASLDINKSMFGKRFLVENGLDCKDTALDPIEYAELVESWGVGELLVTFVDREGTQKGYDVDYLKKLVDAVNIPVIVNGGAKDLGDMHRAVEETGVSAVAAGSMFVFKGKHRAVLINYPSYNELVEFGLHF